MADERAGSDAGTRVRFGLQIPSFTFPTRPRDNVYDVARDLALGAESLGVESVWLMDHLFQIPVVAPETDPILDCWIGLAGLAAETSSIRIGTLVAAAGFRPPSILAKMTATLDVLSHGRLIVGIGAGWCDWEHRAYGLPFPPIGERMARLEESICILRAMWSEERATYLGKHFQVENAVCAPKPLQRPHPPVLIGGSGAKVTLRLTAQYAQMHNLGSGGLDEARRVLGLLREHCRRLGTSYDAITKTRLTPILFADGPADAERRVRELCPAGETEKGFRARTLIGTPAEIAEQLRAYVALGVDYFITSFFDPDPAEPLRVLMREVAPRLGVRDKPAAAGVPRGESR
jgi:F420-dependent oxidoreductase-like protein